MTTKKADIIAKKADLITTSLSEPEALNPTKRIRNTVLKACPVCGKLKSQTTHDRHYIRCLEKEFEETERKKALYHAKCLQISWPYWMGYKLSCLWKKLKNCFKSAIFKGC